MLHWTSFRTDARRHLNRFQEEFVSGDNNRLKYAALELRMAMEALTYARAMAYKKEFPPDEYGTWQPQKVMAVLLEFDPMADRDTSLAYGREEKEGSPPREWKRLGSETVLNMAALKKHYHALGSYLHVQNMKQVRSGKPLDFDKIRSRCETIAAMVREAVESRVFNITLGRFFMLPACDGCGNPIRKRLPHGQNETPVKCYECPASYTLVDIGNGQIEWKLDQEEVECASDACKRTIPIWSRQIEIGHSWTCPGCRGQNTVVFGLQHSPET